MKKSVLFTGASSTRVTPDLAALRAQFAASRADGVQAGPSPAEVTAGSKRPREEPLADDAAASTARPLERSAKSRAPKGAASTSAVEELVQKHRPVASRPASDPRFSNMYGGFNQGMYKSAYAFIGDQQEDEQHQRFKHMKQLRAMVRAAEVEQAGEAAADYGIDEDLRALFDGDEERLQTLRYLPVRELRAQADALRTEINAYKSRAGDAAAKSRAASVRKGIITKELRAVRDGTKAKPYVPKRAAVKAAVESNRFDHLAQKGSANAAKYLEKKQKKKINIR